MTSVAIASFPYQLKLTSPAFENKSQLEEVMEKETYKNAKLILERFDPEAKKRAVSDLLPVSPFLFLEFDLVETTPSLLVVLGSFLMLTKLVRVDNG